MVEAGTNAEALPQLQREIAVRWQGGTSRELMSFYCPQCKSTTYFNGVTGETSVSRFVTETKK